MAKNRTQKGFTLIELLIVVAIIGIIAAILIPNFLDALQKGRQKRSMGDMRQIATAAAAYFTDNAGAGAAGALSYTTADVASTSSPAEGAAAVGAILVPDYTPSMPNTDGWGTAYEIAMSTTSIPSTGYLFIASLGSDKTAGTRATQAYDPKAHENDIVLYDGSFIYYPAGFNTAAGGGSTP